jgi:hypothetical protein
MVYKHYLPLQKVSVVCLGDAHCPICANNRKLVSDNPGIQYTAIKGIIGRQTRFMVNVYNRTLVKITPNGNVVYAQNGQFPMQDAASGEIITNIEAKPLNRVEVLERGSKLFAQLNDINKSVTDLETGKPLGLQNFDLVLTSTGTGRNMNTTPIPYPQYNDAVKVNAEELYDIPSIPLKLTEFEINELLRGVQIRDIFSARRAEDSIEPTIDKKLDEMGETAQESLDSIGDLFAEDSD